MNPKRKVQIKRGTARRARRDKLRASWSLYCASPNAQKISLAQYEREFPLAKGVDHAQS